MQRFMTYLSDSVFRLKGAGLLAACKGFNPSVENSKCVNHSENSITTLSVNTQTLVTQLITHSCILASKMKEWLCSDPYHKDGQELIQKN